MTITNEVVRVFKRIVTSHDSEGRAIVLSDARPARVRAGNSRRRAIAFAYGLENYEAVEKKVAEMKNQTRGEVPERARRR